MSEQDVNQVSEGAAEVEAGSGILRRLVMFLLRLGIVLVLGVCLGVAVYVGAPGLFRALTEPVAQNTADLETLRGDLESVLDREEREQERLRNQLNELGAELTETEELAVSQRAALEDLRERSEGMESRVDDLELLLERVSTAEETLVELEGRIAQLEATDPTAEAMIEGLVEQYGILRTMELVSRARAEIARDNYGLAEENLAAAVDGLQALRERDGGFGEDQLEAAIERLELAREALAESPTVANEDLDSAWRQLVELSEMGKRAP